LDLSWHGYSPRSATSQRDPGCVKTRTTKTRGRHREARAKPIFSAFKVLTTQLAPLSSGLHKGNRSTEIPLRAEDVSSAGLSKAAVLHETNVATADRQTGKVQAILEVRCWDTKGSFKCFRSSEDN